VRSARNILHIVSRILCNAMRAQYCMPPASSCGESGEIVHVRVVLYFLLFYICVRQWARFPATLCKEDCVCVLDIILSLKMSKITDTHKNANLRTKKNMIARARVPGRASARWDGKRNVF